MDEARPASEREGRHEGRGRETLGVCTGHSEQKRSRNKRAACLYACLSQSTRKWPDPAKPSRLNAYLPNGVRLTLECLGQDAELVCVMIETLGRGDVSSGR